MTKILASHVSGGNQSILCSKRWILCSLIFTIYDIKVDKMSGSQPPPPATTSSIHEYIRFRCVLTVLHLTACIDSANVHWLNQYMLPSVKQLSNFRQSLLIPFINNPVFEIESRLSYWIATNPDGLIRFTMNAQCQATGCGRGVFFVFSEISLTTHPPQ